MVRVELPLYGRNVTPNGAKKVNRFKQISAKRSAREEAWALTRTQLHGADLSELGAECLRLEVDFNFPDSIPRDIDNSFAACKPMIDGMCLALKIDDVKFCEAILRRNYSTNRPGVVFVISAMEGYLG